MWIREGLKRGKKPEFNPKKRESILHKKNLIVKRIIVWFFSILFYIRYLFVW